MNGNRAAAAYPLRIGVTGHRKLPDPTAVARAARRLVETLAGTLGSAGGDAARPIEWIALSPLAAGADRIVASAVLAMPGARLEVVSPFALADYREDFRGAEDRAEFEELLRRDPRPTVLKNRYARPRPDDSPAEIARKKAVRLDGYLDAGRRVVDGCEILVAVWDGQRPSSRASTGAIVRYAVGRGRTVLWIPSRQPASPARRIVGIREVAGTADWEVVCEPLPALPEELAPGLMC